MSASRSRSAHGGFGHRDANPMIYCDGFSRPARRRCMQRYRRLWTLGLISATATIASLPVGNHLSAQAPPLSSGPMSVDTGTVEASPRLLAGPKGETLRLSYRSAPSGATGIVVATPSTGNEWKTLVEIIPSEKDVSAGNADIALGPDGQLTVAYQWWRRMPTSSKQ